MTGMKIEFPILAIVAAALTFSGCTTDNVGAVEKGEKNAEAQLKNASGEDVGTARFTQTPNGVDVRLEASNLKAGSLALHIHENGTCEPPKFESAGDHFNPTSAVHGFEANHGPHLGDLRNITVDHDGKADIDQFVNRVSIDGEYSILGKALVIHSGPDDYHTQPSGGAGDRVACGVIERK